MKRKEWNAERSCRGTMLLTPVFFAVQRESPMKLLEIFDEIFVQIYA